MIRRLGLEKNLLWMSFGFGLLSGGKLLKSIWKAICRLVEQVVLSSIVVDSNQFTVISSQWSVHSGQFTVPLKARGLKIKTQSKHLNQRVILGLIQRFPSFILWNLVLFLLPLDLRTISISRLVLGM